MPMLFTTDSAASITGFRNRIGAILANEVANGQRRNIVIFAIDGIPYELALSFWRHAEVSRMCSVFPTTSAAAWLSSLTGANVERHGIPGVMFKAANGEVINVFEYKGPLNIPITGNIFTDAAEHGYRAMSIVGDCEPYDCSWRDALLAQSQWVRGHRFFTDSPVKDPEALCRDILGAIKPCLDTSQSNSPTLVWCFIDADRQIHATGYDSEIVRFLKLIDEIACGLINHETIVIAHSDHGLTPTRHNQEIEQLLKRVQVEEGCVMGGAGRARWLYVRTGTAERLVARLQRSLLPTVEVYSAREIFGEESLLLSSVGEIVLVASGQDFITAPNQGYEHGSWTPNEFNVPFAQWTN